MSRPSGAQAPQTMSVEEDPKEPGSGPYTG
jgi:hypothetical protein